MQTDIECRQHNHRCEESNSCTELIIPLDKKDFWDLHMLRDHYSIDQMLSLYEERYPYGATKEECTSGLPNFSVADSEPDPICLQEKVWQLIKLDFVNL